MMTASFLLWAKWINLFVCCGVVYSVFCRGAKADGVLRPVHPRVKRAFVLLAFLAFLSGIIPFSYSGYVILCPILLGIGIGNLQHVTGQFWHRGPPVPFLE